MTTATDIPPTITSATSSNISTVYDGGPHKGKSYVVDIYTPDPILKNRGSGLKGFVTTARQYADESSIHGFRYFMGYFEPPWQNWWTRVLWAILFVVSCAVCILIFYPIYLKFINDATLTLSNTVQLTETEFPAVTFCNVNLYRRSMVGQHAVNYVLMNPLTKLRATEQQRHDMCDSKPFYDTVPFFPHNKSEHDELFSNIGSLGANFGFLSQLLMSPNVYQSIHGCYFMDKKLTDAECYAAFHNRILSTKSCFTFNPSTELSNFSTKHIDDDVSESVSSTYPTRLQGLVDFKVRNRGRATSVELLLNVQQYEYCTTGIDNMVGFVAQVHARDVQPIFLELMDDVILLSPGRSVTLAISEERIVRKTSSAGWCSQDVKLKYYKRKDYDRNACYNECVMINLMRLCECLPTYAPVDALAEQFMTLKASGSTEQAVFSIMAKTLCSERINGISSCVEKYLQSLMADSSIATTCSRCMTPCLERNYRVHKTETVFPPNDMFSLYKDLKYPNINYTALRSITSSSDFNRMTMYLQSLDKRTYKAAEPFKNIEEVRENLVHVRLEVKSMNVMIKTEDFAVSISELTTQLGGAIGLFVGASMLSIFEIIFWCWMAIRKSF